MLKAEFFVLTSVLRGILLRRFVELDDRDALFSVERHLFLKIFGVQVHDRGFDWIVH